MSLVARILEAGGIPTVVLGSALDIVEHCGVPRFCYVDFPLGNPCGKPWDREMQASILATALAMFETATSPRTTVRTPFGWSEDEGWRTRFLEVRPEDRERLARAGAERRALRAARKR